MKADYAQILDGCRRNDRRAQKALYVEFAPMAMGVCMRYASDRDAAQDLMQDGFIRVFEHIGTVQQPQSLGAWIHRTMVNVCLRDFRRRKLQLTDITAAEDNTTLPLDPFAGQEIVLALQQLPPAQRTAFNLIEVEGYSYSEAAEQLRCSEVNLRSLVCRAKTELRRILKHNR